MADKEKFIECARKNNIKIEDYSITKITNYRQAMEFFKDLRENDVQLGMDMSSLTCSGDVELMGIYPKHVCIIENDNHSYDYFKFKEMVIISGELSNPNSAPEIFIEADVDEEFLEKYASDGFSYIGEKRYLGLEIEDEGRVIYDKDSVQEYLDIEYNSYYDSDIVAPKLKKIVRNTKRELLVYLNVQGYKIRHKGNSILYKAHNYTCAQLIEAFSKIYTEI